MRALILAAGDGTRMHSSLPKVLFGVCGKPMLLHVLDAAQPLAPERMTVVIGAGAEQVKPWLPPEVETIEQRERRGTGDAVRVAQARLNGFRGELLVIPGDTPLVSTDTLRRLIECHREHQAACTLVTAQPASPIGYGRIVRDEQGRILRIVEELDALERERAISEVNTGIYCFWAPTLFDLLPRLQTINRKGEYYLTDVIELLATEGHRIGSVSVGPDEIIGVNSRADLARAQTLMRQRILHHLMASGVTVVDPHTAYVDADVVIGQDTVIHPMTVIERGVVIGSHCEIGPYCRLRRGTVIEDGAVVGNFVEVNRSRVGRGSKVKHLTYLGDTVIEAEVNVGAGTITANYDGHAKHQTVIEEQAFIGSGTILVAPVRVGRRAVTGAGAVVTKGQDVPPDTVVVGVPAKPLKQRVESRVKS